MFIAVRAIIFRFSLSPSPFIPIGGETPAFSRVLLPFDVDFLRPHEFISSPVFPAIADPVKAAIPPPPRTSMRDVKETSRHQQVHISLKHWARESISHSVSIGVNDPAIVHKDIFSLAPGTLSLPLKFSSDIEITQNRLGISAKFPIRSGFQHLRFIYDNLAAHRSPPTQAAMPAGKNGMGVLPQAPAADNF